jgi:2',3'-cyclic-nucleotide 2'-phosphodiesterase (5'-nucleotidase family)
MAFRRIAAFLLVVLLAGVQPALCLSGSDIAGTVPQLLTAVSARNARSNECTLGDAVADAVRASLGADIAIICGGDLVQNLLPGETTYDALKAIFKEDRPLAVADVTSKELRAILEAGLSHITRDNTEAIDSAASAYDGFPQISGFTLSYDASALPGERVREVKMGGKQINLEDDTTVYRLAATGFMLDGGYGLPTVQGAADSELTLSGALAQYINAGMDEYNEMRLRIYPVGARAGFLNGVFPIGIVAVVILLILLGNGQRFKRMFHFER